MLSFYLALIDNEPSRALFEQIYLSHRQTMVYAANRILHDQMLAEDATHDAFLRIIYHMEKISDPYCHKTRGFVVLIVRNIALDYCRKMKRLAETSFDEIDYIFEDPDLDPVEMFQQIENRELFNQKVAKLRPIYAEVIALRYTYEYSDLEIAALLGISGDTVRKRLQRARKLLKLDFEDEGDR